MLQRELVLINSGFLLCRFETLAILTIVTDRQAEDVLVSCYYLNKKLEFFAIPSAQVGGIQIAELGPWVSIMEPGVLFFVLFSLLLCCEYIF